MGTAPIVELARAYGLHPRLWLLLLYRYTDNDVLDDIPKISEDSPKISVGHTNIFDKFWKRSKFS